MQKPLVLRCDSFNQSSRKGARIDCVVLHHTASNNFEQDLRTLTLPNGEKSVSAHYLIGPLGTIVQLVPDEMKAWHAGESQLHGAKEVSVNSHSIGIEIVNDGLANQGSPYTEAQYRALEQLVPWLMLTYGVPMENLVGHKDVSPGRKYDPSPDFDFERIRRAVRAAQLGGAKAA